jgi:hypothetical protein
MKAFLAFSIFAATLVPAQQIDRIVAVVNNQAIVESEWEQQERFEALSNEEQFRGFQHSTASLDRIIDRRLILQQLGNTRVNVADKAEVAAQVTSLRSQLHLESDQAWKAKLKQYGLLEADISDIVAEQANVLRFIDTRFRIAVQVAPEDVRRYYNQTFVPEFRRTGKGAQPPKLDEVRAKIEAVLIQQRMNDLFTTWLKTIRAQANIRIFSKDDQK